MLILRIVAGMPPADIAAAFFMGKEAVRSRLLRAKRKIVASAIPFDLPKQRHFVERMASVHASIYLIFNEGYKPSRGDASQRRELAHEAIRLARILVNLTQDSSEARSLLALLLLTDSRSPARMMDDGTYASLQEQDRSKWDDAQIAEALLLLEDRSLHLGIFGLQARISAEHCLSESFKTTNFAAIANLYEKLIAIEDRESFRLGRCVALIFSGQTELAAADLDSIRENTVSDPNGYLVAKVELYLMTGKNLLAVDCLKQLRSLSRSDTVIATINRRLKDLASTIKSQN